MLTSVDSGTCSSALAIDSNGKIIAVSCCAGGGGSAGGWDFGAGYITNSTSTDTVIVGGTSTTTANVLFEVKGLSFTQGIISNASSTIFNLFSFTSTSTNATSTNMNVTGNFRVPSLTSAILLTGATGIAAEYAGDSCT